MAGSPTTQEAALRFIVVADSHVRPSDQETEVYPSNGRLVGRSEFVVDLCNRIDAAFVIHLGDIVHPIPVEESHAEAIDIAGAVYGRLEHPVHFVAGNHDVGDKPNALVGVPAVAEEHYAIFERAWGHSFYSFEVHGCHFVIVDSQVLNSDLERAHRQRVWLEGDLEEASRSGFRIFIFTHYPPFVRDRQENEHYDNIGEPARSWILDLCERHGVEAVFSGHVHTFLYNRHEGTDLYVAPATGFVRPDYAEVAAVRPSAEFGRDDPPKLGIFVVDVTNDGHVVRPIRTYGSISTDRALPVPEQVALDSGWKSPVGVTLRHGWNTVTDFPTAGLDEFRRKRIRNDTPLLALWEARIEDIRIPLEDLATKAGIARLKDLTAGGLRFSVFSAGGVDPAAIRIMEAASGLLHRWEIIVAAERFADVLEEVAAWDLGDIRLAIAPIAHIETPTSGTHHFVTSGFDVTGDPLLAVLGACDHRSSITDIAFRAPWGSRVGDVLVAARSLAEEMGRRAIVIAELPRGSESVAFDDDQAVADRTAEIAEAAMAEPGVDVFLDAFTDHDRGYYPRHALIDRAFNPRPALYRLIKASSR